MRKSLLLPGLYALVVVPLAWFVRSGVGTHMSPMLLYVPAAPWWLLFQAETTGSEIRALTLGCTINFLVLVAAGMAWHARARRRDRGRQ